MMLQAIGGCIGNPIAWSREPTIDEILADSGVRAVMRADGVDPVKLEAMLRRIAVKRSEGGTCG
jgi:CTP:molybdopterin cytidylyltransferase MocA